MTVVPLEIEHGPMATVLARVGKTTRAGRGRIGCCPVHGDRKPSLSITTGDDGRVLLNCHAGCSVEDVVAALDLKMSDLFPERPSGFVDLDQQRNGVTVSDLACRMRLPSDALTVFGVRDAEHFGRPCVEFAYAHRDGVLARTRIRVALTGDRFRWKGKEGAIIAYEPDRGELAANQHEVTLVEGESDTLTLLYAGFAAVGIPGANFTHTVEPHHVAHAERVYVVREPDVGGETFVAGVRERLAEIGFAGELHALAMPDKAKDPNALWQRCPDLGAFRTQLENAMRVAREPPRPAYRLLSEMVVDYLRPVGQRFQTGFPALDAATRGGIPLGRVLVVSGAPGAGKSTLGVQLAESFERQGGAVVYLAADEPAEGIVTRLGQLAGFSRDSLESEGDVGDAVRAGLASRSEGRRIAVIDPDADEAMRTIEDAEKALFHVAGDRPRVLVVDSLQTAQCAAADGADSARERIDAKVATLKAIAKRGVLVIAISEMARSGYRTGDRNTDTSALAASKESGAIEYGASLLLGLRSVRGEHGCVDVEVAKNRLGGRKPEFRLQLDFDRASFQEVAMPEERDTRRSSEEAKAAAARQRVLEAARKDSSFKSANALSRAAGGDRNANLLMIRELLDEGTLTKVGGTFRVDAGQGKA